MPELQAGWSFDIRQRESMFHRTKGVNLSVFLPEALPCPKESLHACHGCK